MTKLKDFGIAAARVPLSGAVAGYEDDITLPWLGDIARGEVKARADGFKEIYKWLSPTRVLFLKANRQEPLAVIRLKDFADLLKRANQCWWLLEGAHRSYGPPDTPGAPNMRLLSLQEQN